MAEVALRNHALMKQITTRTAGFSDLIILNKLFVQSVDSDFSYFNESFKKKLIQQHNLPRLVKATISPRAYLFLAYRDRDPVGYCIVRTSQDVTYLHWMYVIEEVRGQGYGTELLHQAIDISRRRRTRRLQLVTHDKQAFYRKHGLSEVAHIPGLQGGVDMTIMEFNHA